MVKPSGRASATASSVTASSSSRWSSDQGDATIGSSSWWSPSARCSIDCTIHCPSRRASVQYSSSVISSSLSPLRMMRFPFPSST